MLKPPTTYGAEICRDQNYDQKSTLQDISQIDKAISEDEIFANVNDSPYLTALYGIIGQIRYQRQPFCELIVTPKI